MLGRKEKISYFCDMNDLAINIEYLLLSHNSVIVPSLGAFYAEHTPARCVEGEDVFLPPVRHIRFDATLNVDPEDTFLHSFAELYGCNFITARKRCQDMVSDFHRRLISDGSLDFGSIGVFTLEDDAEITLASCECGVITPSYYGLDTLHFQTLRPESRSAEGAKTIMEVKSDKMLCDNDSEKTTTNRNSSERNSKKSSETHYTIRLNKSAVNYAMAIAATIALFFIMKPTTVNTLDPIRQQARPVMFLQPDMVHRTESSPLILSEAANDSLSLSDALNEEMDQNGMDGVLVDYTEESTNQEENSPVAETPTRTQTGAALNTQTDKVEATKTAPAKPTAATSSKTEPAKVASAASAKATTASTKTETPKSSASAAETTRYCIVMASGVAKGNAEVFVSKLAKDGIHATILEGDLRRVVVDGFSSYDSARQYMTTIKAAGHCPDAWILKQ